ncbi:MAG: DNA polymerase IV [Saezia sp.]
MSPQQRFIAHLDMDAFYACAELLRYPQLKGLPVVIGGRRQNHTHAFDATLPIEKWPRLHSYTGRGVVTTATYEARALGVHSAMGIMKAASLAPDAILIPADFDRYRHFSRLFKQAVAQIAPLIEDRGIDEIYIDLSSLPHMADTTPDDPMAGAREIAKNIKQAVFETTGLTCSIGVSPNKLLSKLCSDLEKPNGLTLLRMEDIPQRIWPLRVETINGIGPRTRQKLHALNICTIDELAHTELAVLIEHFGGRTANWLHQSANGIDERPVETSREVKSVSRETTFEEDLHILRDKQTLTQVFTQLCERVAHDMKNKDLVGRNVSIKVRFDNFETVTRAITLPNYIQDAVSIRQAASQCLKRIIFERKIRLLGVGISTLLPYSENLIHQQQTEQEKNLSLF